MNLEMESNRGNLTQGRIFSTLVNLAIPIMATSFVHMAYNLTDMMWLGRVGSGAVAAVGTAGFFTWLSYSLIAITRIGAEIGVSQAIGGKDYEKAKKYACNALQLNMFLAAIYGVVIFLNAENVIGFFNYKEKTVVVNAISYLRIAMVGNLFFFINPVFSAIFTGSGDSRTPFIISSVGLGLNMVLDPLFIFGLKVWGVSIPSMGVDGAAYATVISQVLVALIFSLYFFEGKYRYFSLNIYTSPSKDCLLKIIKLGAPTALHSGLFTVFSLFLTRIVATWGAVPVAVQKVGEQIEAISWMTASGFSSALSSFVGQNYGAKRWDRIAKGYFIAISIMTVVGVFSSCLLIFGAEPIFTLFINEPETVRQGIIYLKILGISQLFMCVEITTGGAFNGLGRTLPPSIVGIVFTGSRIPAAIILSSASILGLSGIWWSISLSSVVKGLVLVTWFALFLYYHPQLANIKWREHLFMKRVCKS